MSAGRWKRREREIAVMLGGARLPNTGYGQPDVVTEDLAVQVKTLPGWLHDATDQAARDTDATEATNSGAVRHRLPVVGLAEAAQGRKTRRYLVVDLDRLLDWLARRPAVMPLSGKD